MKRLLRFPAFNAICVGLFSAFYATVFLVTASSDKFAETLYYVRLTGKPVAYNAFWRRWNLLLARGEHKYIAFVLIALTAVVVVMLLLRRRPYDEYHVDRLLSYLVAAIFLTLMMIAVFYLLILFDSSGVVDKFTMFITINWSTVVAADFVYVLMYRRKA